MTTFGAAFTRALQDGIRRLESYTPGPYAAAAWGLAVFALESAGTWDPCVLNGKARLVSAKPDTIDPSGNMVRDMRPIVYGTSGLRLSHGSGAKGLYQRMPTIVDAGSKDRPKTIRLYETDDPAEQCASAFAFWEDMCRRFVESTPLRGLGDFYALNLVPAYLRRRPRGDVVMADKRGWSEGSEQAARVWGNGYASNAFLDVGEKGWISYDDLEHHVLEAARTDANDARIKAELAAAGL